MDRALPASQSSAVIEVDQVNLRIAAALNLFRRTYRAIDDQLGGWYHDLSDAPPGPVATSVVLLAFRLAGAEPPCAAQCWAFLRQRQIVSDDRQVHGGWAPNIAGNRPTVEATTAVLELLGRGRFALSTAAPDTLAGVRFLADHQNDDGGWGSVLGNTSRTALTARAVTAIGYLDPDHPAVITGVRWLLKHALPAGGWGETPSAEPSVAHTGLALQALTRHGPATAEAAVVNGFGWLDKHLMATSVGNTHPYVESYDVVSEVGGRRRIWRETMHHHGLGIAALAVLHQPGGPPADVLRTVFGAILERQLQDGRWPSPKESPAPALWAVWHCMSALSALRRMPLLWPGDTVFIFGHVVAVRRALAPNRSLRSLVTASRWHRFAILLKRFWTSMLLVGAMIVSLALGLLGALEWTDALLGFLLPVAILVMQETIAKVRRST
jgi:hypothetical protein